MTDRKSQTVDVVVIGAGPAGENVGGRAAAAGLSVAIVERELVGGECSYWACMPSKALLRPGQVLAEIARVPGAREAVSGSLDVAAVLHRRDELSAHLDDSGQVDWVDAAGMRLVRGHGRLDGPRSVTVTAPDGDVTTLQATKAVVVAVGSGPARPPIDGLDRIVCWDNRGATQATAAPRRLLVLGGGVVGVEMAQAWRSLGAEEVTILQRSDRLLQREEPFAARELQDSLEAQGIVVRTSTTVSQVLRNGIDGEVTATLDGGEVMVADELLIATGRRPHTHDLGVETVGLEPGAIIEVDDQLRATGVQDGWLYAVGDVNGRALLTHQGKYQARIAADHIADRLTGRGEERGAFADRTAVPRVVFTEPQIAAVGLTEAAARAEGLRITVVQHPTGGTAGAATMGEGIGGTSQILVDDTRRVIVGATFVGPAVAEMLHAATIAIVGEVPVDRLWHATPAFPTMSEMWLRFLESYGL